MVPGGFRRKYSSAGKGELMAPTQLSTDNEAHPMIEQRRRSFQAAVPSPLRGGHISAPVSPEHRTEATRQRSEAGQSATDIAAGW